MRTEHLREHAQYCLRNDVDEWDDLDVVRALFDGARKFVAWEFTYTLLDRDRREYHGDDIVATIVKKEHRNIPLVLDEVLEHRFDVDVERDQDRLVIPRDELEISSVDPNAPNQTEVAR